MKRFLALITFVTVLMMASAEAHAVSSNTITVSAFVVSKNQCKINTAAATIDFLTLDTIGAPDISASTTVTFVCRGTDNPASFSFTQYNGLHFLAGKKRMQNLSDATVFIPYTLSLNPVNGTVLRNVNQTLTITADLLGADYTAATAGTYEDTVLVNILP